MATLPGIGIFGTNTAVHLLTPVLREKVPVRYSIIFVSSTSYLFEEQCKEVN